MNRLIIYHSEGHNWKSCHVIEKGLLKAYQAIYPDAEFIDLFEQVDLPEGEKFEVIIITHKLSHEFINWLKCSKKYIAQIRWHAFSNFITLLIMWKELDNILKNMTIEFISPSQKQRRRLNMMINADKNEGSHIACPVDQTIFTPAKKTEREELRKKNHFLKDDFVICYAGRLSFAKNIVLLLEIFQELALENKNLKLILCGNFDNISLPEAGLRLTLNAYQMKVMRLLHSMKPDIRSRVILKGNLSSRDLSKVFKSTDLFISLSTYMMEDFGIGPAEALSSGLPALLTDWGGMHDLYDLCPDGVQLAKVRMTKGNLEIDLEEVKYLISKFYRDRKLTKGANSFSVDSLIERLKNHYPRYMVYKGIDPQYLKEHLPQEKKFHSRLSFTPEVIELYKTYATKSSVKGSWFSITSHWESILENLRKPNVLFSPLKDEDIAKHWPAMKYYPELIPSIYLKQFSSNLNQETIILRDGIKELTNFFQKRKSPLANFSGILLIHHDFKALIKIPENWKSRIGYFAYSSVNGKTGKRSKLICVVNHQKSLSVLEKKILNERLQDNDKDVFFVNGLNVPAPGINRFLVKNSIKYLEWRKFLNIQDFSDYEYFELKNENLSMKNFTEDFVADRGGKIISGKLSQVTQKFLVSPYRELLLVYEKK